MCTFIEAFIAPFAIVAHYSRKVWDHGCNKLGMAWVNLVCYNGGLLLGGLKVITNMGEHSSFWEGKNHDVL